MTDGPFIQLLKNMVKKVRTADSAGVVTPFWAIWGRRLKARVWFMILLPFFVRIDCFDRA